MRRRDIISSQLLLRVAASLIVSLLAAGPVSAIAKLPDDLEIVIASTGPDMVSDGDVLVRIYVPPGVAFNDFAILLNGQAVTSAFRPEGSGHSLLGLVEGSKCLARH
jgi:uncharacterized tannase-like protein DUF6351